MALSRACRCAVVAVLVVLPLLLLAPSASAHAMVVASTPAPGSLLEVAPQDVTITFDESVSVVPDAVRVYGPDGSRVDHGAVLRPGGSGDEVEVAVDAAAEGTYLVSWRVVSADSHPVTGAFTFSVGRRSTAPAVAAVGSDDGLSKLLGLSRAVGYAGSALLLGGTVLLGLAGGAGATGAGRGRRVGRLVGLGLVALVVSAVVALLVQGGYDAGLGWSSIGRPSLVGDVLATTFGRGVVLRLAAAAVFGLALVRTGGRLRSVVLALAGIGVVASFAMTGHGVSSPLQFASTSVHVAVASIWVGGLAVLALIVLPRGTGDVRPLVARFSLVATGCVAVLVATGTYQAWRQVGAWGALTATTYGRELLVKLGLVLLILAAATFSRRWAHGPATGPAARLQRSVEIELVLAMAVIGVTAVIATTMPATVAYHPSASARLTTGPDVVQVSAVPAGDRTMRLDLVVLDASERPTSPAEVDAAVSLPGRDLGPLTITLHRAGIGHMTGTVAVPVVGSWTLSVTVRTTAIDEYTATTPLPIR
ncbi:copper resistance CopC/CopD family protein [Nocardioides ultimimeridianus]